VTGPSIVHSSVEPIGAVRLVPTADPVVMEFVSEILRLEDCVVDAATQAVYPGGATSCAELSWLHPRGEAVESEPVATSYREHGVLAPVTHAVNEFYLLLETCAGLFVCDQAGVLAGADLIGERPAEADSRLDEALALYGCTVPASGLRGSGLRGRRYVRVGELFVPRFWIRPVGADDGHFASPRWAAAGYSALYLEDLRSRLAPLPAPAADRVAFDPQWPAATPADTLTDAIIEACHDAGAIVLPSLVELGLAERAALYARLRSLVAVHGESNVNVVFLPDAATVTEVFTGEDHPGQFAILADLRGLEYSATVAGGGIDSPTTSPLDGRQLAALLDAGTAAGEPGPTAPPLYLLTGVWDNADLLDDWLEHHRSLGVSGVLVMDFGSIDGSVELLRSDRWSSFVEMLPFPGLRADHSLLEAEGARARWSHGWALMIDPDEFLMTATGDLDDPVLRGAMAAADIVTIPRFEMTTRRSLAEASTGGRPDAGDLTLRLVAQDQGKVMFDLESDAIPNLSAHDGHGRAQVFLGDSRICLLHAPVRSYLRYAQKVDHAAITLKANDHLDEGHAWHWRRWIRIRDEGGLNAEYLEQFVPDDDVQGLLAEGTYAVDERLREAVHAARAEPPRSSRRSL
jgi:hypothetical protein